KLLRPGAGRSPITVNQQQRRRDARPPAGAYIAPMSDHSSGLQPPVAVLAIAAHRDDVELTCGGTLIKTAKAGHRTAIIDLTQGEMGTRGSAALRQQEAERAAEIIGCSARETLGLPDAGIVNTPETRELLVRAIRRFRPRVVIAPPLQGRHP